jgi:hypothetical protein
LKWVFAITVGGCGSWGEQRLPGLAHQLFPLDSPALRTMLSNSSRRTTHSTPWAELRLRKLRARRSIMKRRLASPPRPVEEERTIGRDLDARGALPDTHTKGALTFLP